MARPLTRPSTICRSFGRPFSDTRRKLAATDPAFLAIVPGAEAQFAGVSESACQALVVSVDNWKRAEGDVPATGPWMSLGWTCPEAWLSPLVPPSGTSRPGGWMPSEPSRSAAQPCLSAGVSMALATICM